MRSRINAAEGGIMSTGIVLINASRGEFFSA